MTMRDRAVELARQGFRVFPLPVGRKDPPITPAGYTEPPEGEYHQHIPTSDPKEAARMWTGAKGQSLDYNIGYCTNDFFAVDIDNKNGKNGEKAFAELVAWYGLDVNTVEARTPTGGRHLLYKLPNGGVAKNTASRLGDGVDTRGWHGYLVAPGSRVTAGEYTWVRPPGSVPMATVPAELLARVLASKEKPKLQVAEGVELDRPEAIESATKWLQDHAPEAHEGCGGDLTTYRVACNVKDFGISQDMCLDLLAEHWNDQKAAPPWSIDELEVKVENAYSYGKLPIGAGSAQADFDVVDVEIGEKRKSTSKATQAQKHKQEQKERERISLPFWNFDPNEKPARKGWLIKGVAAKGETAGWIGPPGSGKSAAVLDWFMHGATGRDWRGHKCKEKTAFVYFAFERAQLTRRRILAYAMEWGLTTVPIAVVNKVLNLLDTKTMPVVLDTIKAAEDFFGLPVGAITFDTFPKGIAAGGGDENSARDVNMAATNLRRLHEQADLHIALIGHTGKDESKGSRGSNANQGDWDVDFRIAKKDDGIKTVRIEKANDQEEGPVTAFRLEQVKIGVGEDLEDIRTSILSAEIPTVTTARNNGGEDRLSDREALALRALSHCLAEHGINPELPGFSDAEGHVCPVKTWRDELISRGLLEKQASGGHRTQFQRLRLALERKGQIGQKDGYVWLLIQHNPG